MGKVFMDAFDGDGDVVDVNIREGLGRNQSQNRFNEKRMLKQDDPHHSFYDDWY